MKARTLNDIYKEYKIMPSLAMHQMRVAAVAKFISNSLLKPFDANNVIEAALFHDMGNVIKADLSLFPEFLEPKGYEYWKNVKREFIEKYGTNEESANVSIAEEIGVGARALELIQTVGFSRMREINESNDFEKKLLEYADMRVGPYGVVSITERIREGSVRYAGKKNGFTASRYAVLVSALQQMENDVLGQSKIKPQDITDENISEIIVELKKCTL